MLQAVRKQILPTSNRLINACFSTSSSQASSGEVEYGVPTKMMASEAFVEAMLAQGVSDIFGIVGSAFMDPLDLFPEAGIRFLSVQHEQNAGHMADGYSRVTGKHGVCIAQNGPGFNSNSLRHIFS